MISFGKLTHLRRLQDPDSGRILTVAIDHAPSYGVLAGLENIADVIQRVAEGKPDAIMLMQGPAQLCYEPYAGRIPLILKTSTLSPFHPAKDVWVTTVAKAPNSCRNAQPAARACRLLSTVPAKPNLAKPEPKRNRHAKKLKMM